MYTTLYARSLDGKIKVWKINDCYNYILIEYGQYGGNLITRKIPITMASSESQFKSMIRKKKKEGYKDVNEIYKLTNEFTANVNLAYLQKNLPKSNLDDNYNLKPMKCKPFKKGKMLYPAIGQPKANGVRGVLRWETTTVSDGIFATDVAGAMLRSKEGLQYHLPHITDNITEDFFIDTESGRKVAWDGEIYLHGTPINMINSASPLINHHGTIAKTRYPHITPQLKFVIFDVATEDLTQDKRIDMVETIVPFTNYEGVSLLKSRIINSDEEAIAYMMECIADGYEGAVIRSMHTEYAFGSRPMTIMKLKVKQDAEFEVIDVIPKPKEPSTSIFVCRNDINRATFKCNPMGTYEQRKEYLDNKEAYIGKLATVKFYERIGVDDVPFHGNVVTIRREGT